MDNQKIPIGNVECFAQWREIKGKFITFYQLCIGKIVVAQYYYDGSITKGDSKKYKVTSPLPTIKSNLGNFETKEECEEKCYNTVYAFFEQLSYSEKEEWKDIKEEKPKVGTEIFASTKTGGMKGSYINHDIMQTKSGLVNFTKWKYQK